MGLFNFFKKGPAADDTDELQVKGTAYDTTARALPPIRGTIHGEKGSKPGYVQLHWERPTDM
jgi:hypothetical protein